MAVPFNNTNAVRHGARSERFGLVHAKLGKRFAAAYGDVNKLRRAVEALLGESHGGEALVRQARIQTMIRCEETCRAAERLIRENQKMPAAEVRQLRELIYRHGLTRDKLLTGLLGVKGSGTPGEDIWSALDGYDPQDGTDVDRSPNSAPDAATEPQETHLLLVPPEPSEEDRDP